LNKQISNSVSEQVIEQNELTTSQSNSKIPFVEPTVSTPEDVLEATTFFQAPTVDTTSV
jgi:hypothetical protein